MEPRRPDPPDFSRTLTRLRQEAGWTQRDLALHADIDQGYLNRLEKGWHKRTNPTHWQEAKPSKRILDDIVVALDPEGSGWADELYRLRGFDLPRRVRETHATDKQLRGLPTAGGDLDDLSPEDVKALLLDLASRINPEQDRGSGADRGGARGSGTAYGAATG